MRLEEVENEVILFVCMDCDQVFEAGGQLRKRHRDPSQRRGKREDLDIATDIT
jgi:hypothetical protein